MLVVGLHCSESVGLTSHAFVADAVVRDGLALVIARLEARAGPELSRPLSVGFLGTDHVRGEGNELAGKRVIKITA